MNRGRWLTPSTAAGALACFFLPFYQDTCGDKPRDRTGADMVLAGIWPMVAFFVALLVLPLAVALFANRNKLLIALAGAFAIAVAPAMYLITQATVRYGAYLSVLGTVLSFLGIPFWRRRDGKQ